MQVHHKYGCHHRRQRQHWRQQRELPAIHPAGVVVTIPVPGMSSVGAPCGSRSCTETWRGRQNGLWGQSPSSQVGYVDSLAKRFGENAIIARAGGVRRPIGRWTPQREPRVSK